MPLLQAYELDIKGSDNVEADGQSRVQFVVFFSPDPRIVSVAAKPDVLLSDTQHTNNVNL